MSGKIKIFADSTCDLPSSWIKEYNIGIVPLYVVFGDESLRDGVDITPEQLYARVDQEGKLPKTAAPSPSDFISAFTPFIEQGDDILFIGISTELSSTCQNALIAASELPEGRVTVFDSRNLSCGIGLLVMKAVRAAENGAAMPEIIELLSKTVGEVDCEFVIDTLEYLYKGGRCSGMQNIIGSLLKIRPVIKVIDGSMTPAYKVRGKRKRRWSKCSATPSARSIRWIKILSLLFIRWLKRKPSSFRRSCKRRPVPAKFKSRPPAASFAVTAGHKPSASCIRRRPPEPQFHIIVHETRQCCSLNTRELQLSFSSTIQYEFRSEFCALR